GNLPLFVGWIGTGVLIAILLACVNTMLMTMREQMAEIGIMKSLGFTDSSMFSLMIAQSLTLSCVGGGIGMLISFITQEPTSRLLGSNLPGFQVTSGTFRLAAVISVGLGLVAGLVPAWRVAREKCVEAIRNVD